MPATWFATVWITGQWWKEGRGRVMAIYRAESRARAGIVKWRELNPNSKYILVRSRHRLTHDAEIQLAAHETIEDA